MSGKRGKNRKKRKKEEEFEGKKSNQNIKEIRKRQKREEFKEVIQDINEESDKSKIKKRKRKSDEKYKGKKEKNKKCKKADDEREFKALNSKKNEKCKDLNKDTVSQRETSLIQKINGKKYMSSKNKTVNDKKEQRTDKSTFLPQYHGKDNSKEIHAMFSVYSWNDKSDMKKLSDTNAEDNSGVDCSTEKQNKTGINSDSLVEKQNKAGINSNSEDEKQRLCAVGEETFNPYDKTDVFSFDEIHFPEKQSEVCSTYNFVVEISRPVNRVGYVVDISPTIDISKLDKDYESDSSCNMDTTGDCSFQNTLDNIISHMGDSHSSFEQTTSVKRNRIFSFLLFGKDSELSDKDLSLESDSEEEDSDDELEDSEGSDLFLKKVPKGNKDKEFECNDCQSNQVEGEEEESITETDKVNTSENEHGITIINEENEDNRNGIEVDKTKEHKKYEVMREEPVAEVEEDEYIYEEQCSRDKICKEEEKPVRQEEPTEGEECKQIEREIAEFKELSSKLDEYISSVPMPKDLEDAEIFISSAKYLMEVKSSYEKNNSASSSNKVENSSYPEFINVIREVFSVSMKKIYKSALMFCQHYIQNEMTDETINTDNMDLFLEQFIKCCDDYFLFFLKSIMTDSCACDSLFKAVVKHLKGSLSSFIKIHPFLLLIIFSNYPKVNCIMLCKFLSICKVIFSINFNCSYSLPYLQNLKRFLLFSMLEVYHNTDINQTHYLFRKEAARFYYNIIAKYYPKEEKNVISYLKKILMNKNSKFCSCYGSLCAIRAMGLLVEAEVISEIFPVIVIKLNSVKYFAKDSLEISSVTVCKEVNYFESNQSEFNSEIQFLFSSVNQNDATALSSPEYIDENQFEISKLIAENYSALFAESQPELNLENQSDSIPEYQCEVIPEYQCDPIQEYQWEVIPEYQCNLIPDNQYELAPEVQFVTPEDECDVIPEDECNAIPEDNCNAIPEDECDAIPEDECDAIPEEECDAIPEDEYEVTPEDECEVTPECECEVTPEDECEVTPEDECEVTPEDECEVTPEDQCDVTSEDQCDVTSEDQCDVIPEDECDVIPENECYVIPEDECGVIPEDECDVIPENQCKLILNNPGHDSELIPKNQYELSYENQYEPTFENQIMPEIYRDTSTKQNKADKLISIKKKSTPKSEPQIYEPILYKHLPPSHSATQDESEFSVQENKFDTIIPSEYIYASLIRVELLSACSELTNKYINNLIIVEKAHVFPVTNNSLSSNTLKMFLDYFGQELRDLIPLKYAYETFPLQCDNFTEKLIHDIKFREKLRFSFY